MLASLSAQTWKCSDHRSILAYTVQYGERKENIRRGGAGEIRCLPTTAWGRAADAWSGISVREGISPCVREICRVLLPSRLPHYKPVHLIVSAAPYRYFSLLRRLLQCCIKVILNMMFFTFTHKTHSPVCTNLSLKWGCVSCVNFSVVDPEALQTSEWDAQGN